MDLVVVISPARFTNSSHRRAFLRSSANLFARFVASRFLSFASAAAAIAGTNIA
jgi:hypothetical protein